MDSLGKVVEASSSKSKFVYDVFLSFRGEDTRKNFTDHLYTAVTNSGFRIFRDNDELKKGEGLTTQLDTAIRESEIALIVFSKNYASSTWCLNEVAMIMECKKKATEDDHLKVLPVYYDVNPTDVRKQKGSFKDAFDEHEDRFRNDVNKVRRWREALKEAADLVGMPLQNQANGHEAEFIKNIIKELEQELVSHIVLPVAPLTTGSEKIVKDINFWLQDNSSDVCVGMIHGMRGIGKTNIAKIAYNINYKKFQGCSFLADVKKAKKEKHLVRLQKQVCSDILKKENVIINNSDEGIIKIKKVVGSKKILLVLDGVDDFKQVYGIMGNRSWFYKGSKILVTTRSQWVVKVCPEICRVFKVELLNFYQALQLFCWHAFGQNDPTESFKMLSYTLVRICKGLPLALEVLGRSCNLIIKELCNEEEDTTSDELNMEAIFGAIIEIISHIKDLLSDQEDTTSDKEEDTIGDELNMETIYRSIIIEISHIKDAFSDTEVQEDTTSDELNMDAIYRSIKDLLPDTEVEEDTTSNEISEEEDTTSNELNMDAIYRSIKDLLPDTEVQEDTTSNEISEEEDTTSNELNMDAIYESITEVMAPFERGVQWLFED